MVLNADARRLPLADRSVHCVVTSPPYWGLRDYGVVGQLGLERTPEEYVERMVAVFREVWRVLRDDGTLWLNLGDAYNNRARVRPSSHQPGLNGIVDEDWKVRAANGGVRMSLGGGLKEKDLIGIPWRVAFALQADGWYLRSDVIWSKPNPMPESVTDRPTKAHEYLFLLAKRERYYYDAEAIKEASTTSDPRKPYGSDGAWALDGRDKWAKGAGQPRNGDPAIRNRRSVWEIATQPYPEAHFATFPTELVKPCVLAGTSERGVCAACGAPWERVVEDSPEYTAFKAAEAERKGTGMRSSDPAMIGLTRGTANKSVSAQRLTTGWQPTCACDAPTMQPLVLDPFAGSGTVGQVCHALGRRFVGTELKPEYCQMAMKRTAQLGLI